MKKNILSGKKYLYIVFVVAFFAIVGMLSVTFANAGPSDPNDPDYPLADTNSDNKVDIFDLSYVLSKWTTNDSTADFNNDGIVSIFDLSYLLAQWGRVDTPAGIPYGFWSQSAYYYTSTDFENANTTFNANIHQLSSSSPSYSVNTLLPAAQAAGVSLTLRMTGGHSHYTTDGNFDLAKWKAKLAVWENAGAQPFIDDGTLAGNMILDDISTFAGNDPTAAELDEMARYSKELMPGLMTYVRKHAEGMPVPIANGGKYIYLDAAVNQYKAARGPATAWIEAQRDKSIELGLGVIVGLNIACGGDGSSGQECASSTGLYAMTAEEISEYGQAILSVPEAGMVLNWDYTSSTTWPNGVVNSDYFDQPALTAALEGIGELAGTHVAVDLMQ